MPKLAFIICTEPAIEKESTLLCRSIRKWAGEFSDAPIMSFGPRGLGISSAMEDEFKRLDVRHCNERLNLDFAGYPLANKPFACAFAESVVEADYLVWLDSDMVILNEPAALFYAGDGPMAAKPVTTQNIGVMSLSGTSQNELYWSKLRAICGAMAVRYIYSSVEGARIVEYFNSGIVATRRGSGLFDRWAKNFRAIMHSGSVPSQPYFVEQSVLSATASAWPSAPVLLPESYNYPARNHDRLPVARRITSLEQIVGLHCPGGMATARWADPRGERYEWLVANSRSLE